MQNENQQPAGLGLGEGLGAWQPIETAPRDGTRILVCGGSVSEPEIARRWSTGEVECEMYSDNRIPSDPPDLPTYWMPLPAPPVSA